MKTLGVFSIIIFSFLLSLQSSESQTRLNCSVIGIEYIGPSDHPTWPIVISDSQENAEWFKRTNLKTTNFGVVWVDIVDSYLLKTLLMEAEMRSNSPILKYKGYPLHPTVSLTIVSEGHLRHILLNRGDSLALLIRFDKICQGHGALQSDIQHFKDSVAAWIR